VVTYNQAQMTVTLKKRALQRIKPERHRAHHRNHHSKRCPPVHPFRANEEALDPGDNLPAMPRLKR
jgi:hypothetical protein